MPTTIRKPGSSLLITVLTMAAFTTIAVVSSAFYLASTRVHSLIAAGDTATTVAQAGIQDALLRYDYSIKNPPAVGSTDGVLVGGEYGEGAVANAAGSTAAGAYSLLPLRRGYLAASSCQKLGPDQSAAAATNDTTCPYYDLAVRTSVALTAPGNSVTLPGELFSSTRDLVVKRIADATVVQLQTIGGGTLTYQFCVRTVQPATPGCSWTQNASVSGSAVTQLEALPGVQTIDSFRFTLSGGATAVKVSLAVNKPGYLALEKGFTTIDSTGYAGGAQKRLLLNIYPVNLKYRLREAAQAYDTNGCLNDGSAPASVCTP